MGYLSLHFSLFLLVATLTHLPCTTSAAASPAVHGAWHTTRQIFSPREKPAATCATIDTVVSVGGVTMDGNVNDVWLYNTTTALWREVFAFGDVPSLNAAALVAVGAYQYLFGGQMTGFFGEASGDLYRINAISSTPTWVPVVPKSTNVGEKPQARYRHAMVAVRNDLGGDPQLATGFLVLFGIAPAYFFNDVWFFYPQNETWTELSPNGATGTNIPTPRFNPCCVYYAAAGAAVCFGGTTSSKDSNDVFEFTVATRTWNYLSTSGDQPLPRRLAQCTLVDHRLILHSGFSTQRGPVVDSAIHVLDLQTRVWSTGPSLQGNAPRERSGGVMITCQPNQLSSPIIVFSGTNETHNLNDVWQVVPVASPSSSSGFIFQQLSPETEIPPARSLHLAAVVGESLYILFGLSGDQTWLTDVWSFNMSSELWTLRSTYCPFGSRIGASAVAFGTFVWVYGGKDEAGIFYNDLHIFDTETGLWSEAQPSDFSFLPVPSAFHGAVAANSYMIVFGGETAANPLVNSAALYSLMEQKWYAVLSNSTNTSSNNGSTAPQGNLSTTVPPTTSSTPLPSSSSVPSPRKAFGMIFDIDLEECLILGGDGGNVYPMDRWSMKLLSRIDQNTFAAQYTLLASEIPPGKSEASVIRSQAVVGGITSNYFIAGGGVGTLFPSDYQDSLIHWSRKTGQNTPLPPMPVQVYNAAGGYFRQSLFVVGGSLCMNGLKRPRHALSVVQAFVVDAKASGCTSANETSSPTGFPDCVECSMGTLDPDCVPVPPGYYKATSSTPITPCPAGTASPLPATFSEAACSLCSAGTYNPYEGQEHCIPCPANSICLIGASKPLQGGIGLEEFTTDQQPPPFVQTTPFPIFTVAVGCGGGAAIFVFFTWCLDKRYRKKHLAHFLNPVDVNNVLHVFRMHARDHIQLNARDIVEVMSALQVTSAFTEETVELIITQYRRKFGVKHITEKKFLDIVIMGIACGILEPFPNTPAAKGVTFDPPITLLQLRNVDYFKDEHREFTGNTLVKRKSTTGGIFSLLFGFTVTVYLALQVTQYAFNATVETRSVLPTIVASSTFSSSSASSTEDNANLIWSSFYVEIQINTEAGVCTDATTGKCLAQNIIRQPVGLLIHPAAGVTATCEAPNATVCKMIWTCTKCALNLLEGSSNASINFYFGHSRSYSSKTQAIVRTSTGIRPERNKNQGEELSEASHTFTVNNPNLLFRGYPTTQVVASLLRTSFESDTALVGDRIVTGKGYHVQFQPELKENGNVVTARTFSLFTGLPITVVLVPQEMTLFVKRNLRLSLLDLFAALLGGFSGLAGATVLLMRSFEFFSDMWGVYLAEKRVKEDDEIAAFGDYVELGGMTGKKVQKTAGSFVSSPSGAVFPSNGFTAAASGSYQPPKQQLPTNQLEEKLLPSAAPSPQALRKEPPAAGTVVSQAPSEPTCIVANFQQLKTADAAVQKKVVVAPPTASSCNNDDGPLVPPPETAALNRIPPRQLSTDFADSAHTSSVSPEISRLDSCFAEDEYRHHVVPVPVLLTPSAAGEVPNGITNPAREDYGGNDATPSLGRRRSSTRLLGARVQGAIAKSLDTIL